MWKTIIWTLIFVAAATPMLLYFYQRWRQKQAEKTGVVVYATVVSIEAMKKFGRTLPMKKITLSIQEPGKERRAVTLRTQVADGQDIQPGMLLSIVVDPKSPNRIYPASEEAAKRVIHTGPRRERRQLRSGRGMARGTRPSRINRPR